MAGLGARQLAGIIAHECGHFTQGFGMRLTYVIRRVNEWFARVIYQRDTWDLWLDEMENNAEESSAWIFGFIAKTGVDLCRLVLKLLMLVGHGLGCFLLRQMEYDATPAKSDWSAAAPSSRPPNASMSSASPSRPPTRKSASAGT